MAGKLRKILLGSAVAGAAVAGGLAYFLKKKEKENSWDKEMEDFDDDLTSEDASEDDTPITREYVTIPTEHSHHEETPISEEETEPVEEAAETPSEDTPEAEAATEETTSEETE